MVRFHLTTLFTLLLLSPMAFSESECDRLHNQYTVSCSDTESQCKGLTLCTDIRKRCLTHGTDLGDKQTCSQFQDCLVDFYKDRVSSGNAVGLARQCRYNWNEAIPVQRGSSMKSCKFMGLPWDQVSNNCPGASIFFNGGSLSDPFYNCQATKEKYLKLHQQCEVVKSQLKTQCDISIVENKGRHCPGLDLSPAEITFFRGVGENPGVENAHPPGTTVADGALEAKDTTGFSIWSPSTWSSTIGR